MLLLLGAIAIARLLLLCMIAELLHVAEALWVLLLLLLLLFLLVALRLLAIVLVICAWFNLTHEKRIRTRTHASSTREA